MSNLSHRRLNIFVISLTLLSASVAHAITDIAALSPALLESNVQLIATIQSVQPAKPGSRGPSQITLQDPTGTIPLVFWAKTPDELQTIHGLQPGDTVQVTSKVGRFKGALQLELQSLTNLTVTARATTPPPAAPAAAPLPATPTAKTVIPLAAVKKDIIGETVTVVAKIIHIRTPNIETAPYVITLAQDSTTLPLVLWNDNYQKVKDHLREGQTIRVTGLVNTHKGQLQIKLRNAADLHPQ